jgi:hypothetical protein
VAETLYKGFSSSSASRGYLDIFSWEVALPTLVLGLYLTGGVKKKVYCLTHPSKVTKAIAAIKELASYTFACRKGNVEAVKAIRDAFAALVVTAPVSNLPEPALWVMTGVWEPKTVPSWAEAKLLPGPGEISSSQLP